MKATNIFNSLKAKGVCGTDGIPPKLPGVSAAKFTAQLRQASEDGILNPGFKAVVDADTKKKSSAATYNSMAKYGTTMAKKLGPNDPPKKDEKKDDEITADEINITSYNRKTGKGKRERVLPSGKRVTTSFQVIQKPEKTSDTMANYGTVAKKKSCAKFIPEEAGKRKPNPRKNKARKGVTRMLQNLINSNKGCGPNPYKK